MATLQSLIDQELRQLKGRSAQEAQIGFIGGSGARGQLGRTKEVETQEGRGEGGRGEGGRGEGRGEAGKAARLPCPSPLTWGPGGQVLRPQNSHLPCHPSTPRGGEPAAPLWLHRLRGAASERPDTAQTRPPGAEPPAPHPHGPQLPGGLGCCSSAGLGTLGHSPPTAHTYPRERAKPCPCCPQTLCCSIALRDLQRLHLLSPLEEGRPPGLELNYGSADSPQTIWFELPQVSGQGLSDHPGRLASASPRAGMPGAWAQLMPTGIGGLAGSLSSQVFAPQARELQHTITFLLNSSDTSV